MEVLEKNLCSFKEKKLAKQKLLTKYKFKQNKKKGKLIKGDGE